jgi:hypothetical protein
MMMYISVEEYWCGLGWEVSGRSKEGKQVVVRVGKLEEETINTCVNV